MKEKIKMGPDSAVLEVEPQDGFTNKNGSFGLDGELVVETMNKVAAKSPDVVVTIDWHPPGHISFIKYGVHCVPGTRDARLHPKLSLAPIKAIFMKGTGVNEDIYDSFLIPGLTEYLRARNKKVLFIDGSAIPVCPSDTAISGVKNGFIVYLIWDACCIMPGTDEQKERERLEKAGVKVINFADLA